jgi:TRAP-type C4-dicarboxylate transport system permease large subunit
MVQKLRALAGALPLVGLVLITIGGIYAGLFSPVEASAVGALLAILYGLATRGLSFAGLATALKDSVSTTATVMLILIGAHIIGPFLALSHIPTVVGNFLVGLDLGPHGVLLTILLCYLVLGCFLEGFAMLVLTMPIFFPVITSLGFDPIWFGVVVVLTLEMGLITPARGGQRLHREIRRPACADRRGLRRGRALPRRDDRHGRPADPLARSRALPAPLHDRMSPPMPRTPTERGPR